MKGEIKKLDLKSVTATLAITCYEEQLTNGEAGLKNSISLMPSPVFQVIAINHNKSAQKTHWHILVRACDRNKKFQVASMLKKLGICYEEADNNLLDYRSIETVGDFVSYTTYLLHQTVEAERANKAKYCIDDMISNLQHDEIQQIINGYTIKKKALKSNELNVVMDRAREAGYNLCDYYEFLDSLNISGLKEKEENQIRKSYEAGIRRLKDENVVLPRIFINIISEDIRFALDVVKKTFSEKKQLLLTRDMQYTSEVSNEVIITTWGIEKIIANKQLLLSDGIAEGNSKNSDITGFWTGNYVIIISQVEIGNGLANRCSISKKFFNVGINSDEIKKYKAPTVYVDDEWIEIKKLYDSFIEKLEETMSNE